MSRRIVVTGLGLVTPLGVGVKHVWKSLIAGNSGLISTTELADYDTAGYSSVPSKVIGKVPEGPLSEGKWDSRDHFDNPSEARRVALFGQYALAATQEALLDAEWLPKNEEDLINTGVCVGSGIGSFEDVYDNSVAFHEKGFKRVQPLFIPRLLTNMAAGNISIKHGFKGPNHSVATACATGVHSIGDASRFIKDGYADVMVAGASESTIHPLSMAGFARAKSLVTSFNDTPQKASRPFDKNRDGFVLGEGSGIMILEELDHALKRGVKNIYAEVVGYGLSGDGHHITAPLPDGSGARRSMETALKQANIDPSKIDYVNAHATSTVIGDRAENLAMKSLFGEANPNLAVSSSKSSIGHLLGAAGAVESIFTVLALKYGVLPPTLNCDEPGMGKDDDKEEFVFNYVPNKSQEKDITYALSNSFGFGGVNATLCFKKYEA